MGFIKILRWRLGGALSRLHRPSHPIEIGPLQRAAVFLVVMGREHAGMVLSELGADEARTLTQEINSIASLGIDDDLLREVMEEFLDGFSSEPLPSYVALEELDEVARARLRADPARAAERVRALWLADSFAEFEDDEDDDDALEIGYEQLNSLQKAAVFMMWLPPELTAMVFEKFTPRQIHAVTAVIVELPFVVPEARELILADFMEGVSLGIPGLTIEDVGLPVVVEAFVRSNPGAVARRLETKWLNSPQKEAGPRAFKDKEKLRLTDLQRCAVFFQSLSLPLAYRLLRKMEENEVETVLSAVEELSPVESEARKSVLEELMSSASGHLSGAESESVQVWVKAMGQMIRKRPDVVVNQIRKLWLSEQN